MQEEHKEQYMTLITSNMEKKELTYKQIDKRLGLLIKKVKTLSEMKKKKVQKVLV